MASALYFALGRLQRTSHAAQFALTFFEEIMDGVIKSTCVVEEESAMLPDATIERMCQLARKLLG